MKRRTEAGFTLIELMVSLAIIGVLAALAAQTYTGITLRTKRTEAVNILLGMLNLEKSYWAEHNEWAYAPSQLGFATEGATLISESSMITPTSTVGNSNWRSKNYDTIQFYGLKVAGPDSMWYMTCSGNLDGDTYLDQLWVGEMPGIMAVGHGPLQSYDDLKNAYYWPPI